MVSGESTSYGNGGTAGNGAFKQPFANLIAKYKKYVPKNMVDILGSQYNTNCSYGCAAFPGVRADQLNTTYLTPDLITFAPTSVALSIGANNILHGYSTADTLTQIGSCLDSIRTYCPTARVFWAQITDLKFYHEQVLELNAAIPAYAAARSDASYITVTDIYSALGAWSSTYFSDDKHPNDAGYALWAQALYNAYAAVYG